MRAVLASLLLWLVCASAQAQQTVDSPEADETYLTIYPDNLAMVTEIRKVTLPAGRSTLRFFGVSDQMIARTAVLQSFEGVSLESNFDTDLITKGALVNKAIGAPISVARYNPGDGHKTIVSGTLISAAKTSGVVYGAVIETEEGIETLECAGLAESLLFSRLPKDLNAKPVLSMVVEADVPGEKEITLSYLSSGISWKADYRLDVAGEEGDGPLFGWLTVTNSTSKTFKDVPTNIIAGQINRDYRTRPDVVVKTQYVANCWPKGSTKTGTPNQWVQYQEQNLANLYEAKSIGYFGGAAMAAPQPVAYRTMADGNLAKIESDIAQVEDFADYKLYRVPRPITVAALQTKQIAFLDKKDAEYKRMYKFDLNLWDLGHSQPQQMRVEYEIDNSKEGNLGVPLPEGTMRVMTRRANGNTAFLGESPVRDLAVDLPVEIPVSQSIGVMVTTGHDVIESEGKFAIRLKARVMNATMETINAEIKINSARIRFPDIDKASHPVRVDKVIPTYSIKVAPESAENFYVDIPVEQSVAFTHSPRDYQGKNSYTQRAGGRQINLAGQSGNLSELSNLMQGKGQYGIAVKARINEKETITEDGLRGYRLDESFTFSNALSRPQKIEFVYNCNFVIDTVIVQPAGSEVIGGVERMIPAVTQAVRRCLIDIETSNMSPDNEGEMKWTIVVPAKGERTLDIVSSGQHQLN